MKTLRRSFILEYVLWILFGLLIFAFRQIDTSVFQNPWVFSIAFLYILFLPGWLLSRLFRINIDDLAGRILSYFIFGLSFYLIVNFIAIFAGMSLATLSFVIFILLGVFLIISFFLDLPKKAITDQEISWRQVLKIENIYYLLPVVIGIFILWLVSLKGPGLDGDPYLHLSIIRKALDGSALSPRALAFTKTQLINPAYVYPVWHIFLAFLSKNLSISIFSTWSNIIIALTIISFLAWYYLSKILFQKTSWTILALSFFMIFVFYGGPGYLFTRLSVPDTFGQLILLTLGLAFALKYILDEKIGGLLIINFLLSFMLLIIHGPHYFYLIVSILLFGILYGATHFRDTDYKPTLLKILKVFLVQLAVLVLAGVAIELKSQTLSSSIIEFYKSASGGVAFSTNFTKFGLVYKYGLLLLPLVFYFIKSRRLLFIIATMLLVPLIYWTPLQSIFNKTLSGVFTDRLLANTSLYFYVFALILGAILFFKDRVYTKLGKNVQYLIMGLVILIGILLVFFEIKSQLISDFVYKIFYAKPTNAWVNSHYWWILTIVLVIAIIITIFIGNKKMKIDNFEYQNHLFIFILFLILSYVLISPSIINIRYQIKEPKPLSGQEYFLYLVKNNQKAIDFIQNKIPIQSVVLASPEASKGLSVLVNQYLAYNAGSAYERKLAAVFDQNVSDSVKTEIMSDPKWAIDYIYLVDPANGNSLFRNHPAKYQKIYSDNQIEIYKVIK